MAEAPKDEGRFMLRNVRIVFPNLFKGEAKQQKKPDGTLTDPAYGASFLIAPNDPQIEQIIKPAILKAAQKKFGPEWEAILRAAQAKDKLPIHDGNLKAHLPYGAPYKGMMFINARNQEKAYPGGVPVYDNVQDSNTGQARVITSRNDPHAPYSGCYVNVSLSFWGYTQGDKGISASIAGVQFFKDGERLSGGVVAQATDFEAVPAASQEKAAAGAGAAGLFI